MRRKVFTDKMKAYVQDNYLNKSGGQMAKDLGVSKTPVQTFMRRNNLKVSKEKQFEFKLRALKGRTNYTTAEDDLIRSNYLNVPIKRLADQMGRSYCGIMCRLKAMGLEIPPEVIKKNKDESRIKTGNVPFNKGKKQSEYLSPESLEKVKTTWFKRGHLPENALYDGAIQIRKDTNTCRGYKYIRLSLGQWELYHKYIWEQENGHIADGYCLWFINQDSLDVRLDNLELITRKENYLRNSGSVRLSDPIVAHYLSPRDSELKKELLKFPELIELKRQQIKLNREVNGTNRET